MTPRRIAAVLCACTTSALLAACAGASLPSPDLLSSTTATPPASTASVQPLAAPATLSPSATAQVPATQRAARDGDETLVDPLGDAAATGITGSTLVPATLVSVYSRMARGLNRCWLRDGKPLGKTYVLHAAIDPSPASAGGITVHLRSPTGRRGLKAYHVDLSETGGQTRVTTTNMKLLPRQSRGLTRDLLRWSISGSDCGSYAGIVPAPGRKPGRRRPVSSAF